MSKLRIAFAGDRDISTWVLDFLISHGVHPLALLVSGEDRASHAESLAATCSYLDKKLILTGTAFRTPEGLARLQALDLDYLITVHHPYILPSSVLSIPRVGVLNLHPAFLPYNRGWHTPSWAILEDTPIGATLHFADDGVDTGDIVHQKRLEVSPVDTADSLYHRLKRLELEVFKEAWPSLVAGTYSRSKQDPMAGTLHLRKELFSESLQCITLDREEKPVDLLRRLRALTTNRDDEAAYFVSDGRRYRIRVILYED